MKPPRALFEQHGQGTDVWLTPPDLLAALGSFDLDPCACSEPRPWPTATRHICRPDDGLTAEWSGRVWLNPPYSEANRWLARLAAHGQGMALISARVETSWFFEHVWESASAILFIKGRVQFWRGDGRPSLRNGSSSPSVLVAYGPEDAARLKTCGIPGAYIPLGDDLEGAA